MDIELLLQPLSGGAGECGEDMMFSAEFDAIREARRHDDPSLAQGEWVTELKEADWATVIRRGGALLAGRTKDIRLAVWMTEALAKTRGLAGLADGWTLVAHLCENYWDSVHPQPDEGDLELRIGNLDWLVAQSARLVREVPLTASAKGHFSLADLESARATAAVVERNPLQAEELLSSARVTMEQFEAARRDTAAAHFTQSMAEAGRAQAAVGALRATLDGLLGADAPAFGPLGEALEDVAQALRRYATDAGVPAATDAASARGPAPAHDPAPLAAVSAGPAAGGTITSREQAIRQLSEVAAYFKRTEPHSPVAYLAEKAARWGAMSLHEWLRSVVKDDTALSHVEELLGVDAPRELR